MLASTLNSADALRSPGIPGEARPMPRRITASGWVFRIVVAYAEVGSFRKDCIES